jgi:hypothetical protein
MINQPLSGSYALARRVAVALDKLQLEAGLNKLGKIPGAWTGVLNAIDAVRSTGCS